MGDFKKLLVWRKAHALAINVHRIASKMRGPGMAALRNQMIRAALSIPTNIVEGHGQASLRNFARFLGYSLNSGAELEQHLLTARALDGINESEFRSLTTGLIEVRKMVHGLRASCTQRLEEQDDGGKGKGEGKSEDKSQDDSNPRR